MSHYYVLKTVYLVRLCFKLQKYNLAIGFSVNGSAITILRIYSYILIHCIV